MRRGPGKRYADGVRSYRETEPYRRAIRERKVWAEPLFAEAKAWHGARRFRLRTLRRVNAEALLVAAGPNLKRLLSFGVRRPDRPTPRAVVLHPAATPNVAPRPAAGVSYGVPPSLDGTLSATSCLVYEARILRRTEAHFATAWPTPARLLVSLALT